MIGNLDAQKTLLSCFFQEPVLIELTTVKPEFLFDEYKEILVGMKKLRSENKAISPIAFSEKYEWIWDIASFTFSTKDFELCQDIIIEEHNRRKIKTICENVAFMCQDDKKTASELATMISDGLTLETKEDADNLFPLAFDTFDKIFQQNESIYVINTTGYTQLDPYLGGFRGGSLYILAARPGIGKSTLMLNFMIKIIEAEHHCSILSTEMPTKEIHIRAMSYIGEIESRKIENGIKNVEQQLADKIVAFCKDKLGRCNIYDKFYFEDIERIVSKEAMLGSKVIFIDYLQQIPTQRNHANKNTYIEAITNKLKNLAIKYGIAIVCLSQLKRTNAEPELTDLRDSGAIEQDADVVIFLHNNDEYTGEIDLLVKKNRHRDKGVCRLKFNKKFFRID